MLKVFCSSLLAGQLVFALLVLFACSVLWIAVSFWTSKGQTVQNYSLFFPVMEHSLYLVNPKNTFTATWELPCCWQYSFHNPFIVSLLATGNTTIRTQVSILSLININFLPSSDTSPCGKPSFVKASWKYEFIYHVCCVRIQLRGLKYLWR